MVIRILPLQLLDGFRFYQLLYFLKLLIFKLDFPLGVITRLLAVVASTLSATILLVLPIAFVVWLKQIAKLCLKYFGYFSFLCWLCSPIPVVAQEQVEEIMEAIVEQVSGEQDEPVDITEQLERLRAYLKNPLDLNTADESMLAGLLFLKADQIANLLAHRSLTGSFVSVLELQGIAGFDVLTIQRLLPFVHVGPPNPYTRFSLQSAWKKGEHDLIARYGRVLEEQRGYTIVDTTRSRYLGSPDKYVLRYRWNYEQQVNLAINMKKDAGEPFFAEAQRYGFDHYGFSLSIKNLGLIKQVVIGDFGLQLGQGLLLWNGLSFGKGSWIGSVAKRGAGLRAYTSMTEVDYLRGLAVQLQYKRVSITPFVSYNRLSGNRYVEDGKYVIGTISKTGLHRTPTEQSYRHAIRNWAYGMDLTYSHNRLKIGATVMHTYYNGHVIPLDVAYAAHDFAGEYLTNMSVNYQYTYKNSYIYGEAAHRFLGGWATNNGFLTGMLPALSLFANYRYYSQDYFAPYAQSLQEGSRVANEKGFYTGLIFHPSRKIEWANYLDFFSFPGARYRVDEPSAGKDLLSQFTYLWYKQAKLSLRYRYRLKQENAPAGSASVLADVLKQQIRLDGQYNLSSAWRIRSRAEWAAYVKGEQEQEYGWLFFQDVFWDNPSTPLALNMRLAYFNTDSYNSRIYAYENDVLYASSFPLYQNQGWRFYANCQWRLNRGLNLWLRYAVFNYTDLASVGSGLALSSGNKRSTVTAQLRWQW